AAGRRSYRLPKAAGHSVVFVLPSPVLAKAPHALPLVSKLALVLSAGQEFISACCVVAPALVLSEPGWRERVVFIRVRLCEERLEELARLATLGTVALVLSEPGWHDRLLCLVVYCLEPGRQLGDQGRSDGFRRPCGAR